MALQDTDLFVLYRPSEALHYKMPASDLPAGGGSSDVPDGTEEGQILKWNGSSWVATFIDGGTY